MTDNSLLTTSKDILKDISMDIPGGIWGVAIANEATKAMLKTMREHETTTDYNAADLHITNQDGTIQKIYIPVPWYSREIGAFQLRETTIIYHKGHLDPETKDQLLKEAMKLGYPNPRCIHDIRTIFILCTEKDFIRSSKGTYIIQANPKAEYLFYKFLANGLEAFIDIVISEMPKVFRSTAKIIEIDRAYIDRLRTLKASELKKLNEIGHLTNMSLTGTPKNKLGKLLGEIQ